MSNALAEHDDVVEHLRAIAATAAPATRARPDLAEVVLARRRTRTKKVRRRWTLGCATVLAAGAVVAATPPGNGDYYSYEHPSAAMEPTVKVGEKVVVAKKLSPQRGDLVVFRLRFNGGETDTIKRVIGLAGDRVVCPDSGGGRCEALVVNGVRLPEPYLNGRVGTAFASQTVPAGKLFLLGDNRDASADSRHYGPVADSLVKGVVVRIVDAAGRLRAVPGAPNHPAPTGSDMVDQQAPVPPAPVSTATPPS